MNVAPSVPDLPILLPKVVRTAAKEAGIASLEAVLQGFHIAVESDQLQDALAAETADASLDSLAQVATQFGLEAEQVMLPANYILAPGSQSLPAIVAFRRPNEQTHFVVAWRRHGPFVQVMDPLRGRRWLTERGFVDELSIHTRPVAAQAWRAWAVTEAFQTPLRQRLHELGFNETHVVRLLDAALDAPGWYALAVLDASTRLLGMGIRTKTFGSLQSARALLEQICQQAQIRRDTACSLAAADAEELIPPLCWSVFPSPADAQRSETEAQLLQRGAVLLRLYGRRRPSASAAIDPPTAEDAAAASPPPSQQAGTPPTQNHSTSSSLWQVLSQDGLLVPSVLTAALFTSAISVTLEAVLLQGLMRVGPSLNLFGQRVGAIGVLWVFLILLVLRDVFIFSTSLHLGRRIETRLRMAFLEKIPRLSNDYFSSRPIADLVQRAFSIEEIRGLPSGSVELLEQTFLLLFTAVGIIWLDPGSTVTVLLAIAVYFGIILRLAFPIIVQRNLHVRLQVNNLQRYPLDAMQGVIPIRTHGAERALRRAYEGNLVTWSQAFEALFETMATYLGLVAFLYAGVTAWILYSFISRGGSVESFLLLTYWTLNLPTILAELTRAMSGYASMQSLTQLLHESLTAPDEFATPPEPEDQSADAHRPEAPAVFSQAVAISMRDVRLELSGTTILDHIDLEISAGEHVGIVGASGAGKTMLVGLLLGWYQPTTGQILVAGLPLGGREIRALRRNIAWVDPTIQIWNRSLLDNLLYGTRPCDEPPLMQIIEQADLFQVLEPLPDGFRTSLGEAGGLLSGGEGQRVRLGRAMLRREAPLVILDEPFRGLDRETRRELLGRARQYWQHATLICITHDVGEIRTFERVLVVEAGRIIEDAAPEELAAQPDSRYSTLLRAEEALRQGLWSATDWRHLWLQDGNLQERDQTSVQTTDGQ
ncbi:Vitamin B12 import ATP-binding protein BtuD [Candidatus Entotheonellaceae bacterium PAL068K]